MRRRPDAATLLALAALAASGCSAPASGPLVVGHHRLRLVVPAGWEHLDHGRQQVFRRREQVISLTDFGPASPEALAREIAAARDLWRQGRAEDAFARLRDLRGPVLALATDDQREAFWGPWVEIRNRPVPADSFAMKAAFAALIERCRDLRRVSALAMADYAIGRAGDLRQPEVSRRARRGHRGTEWTEVLLWDRVTHIQRVRLAITEAGGDLLVLRSERGAITLTAPAFEALLESIELAPPPAPAGR